MLIVHRGLGLLHVRNSRADRQPEEWALEVRLFYFVTLKLFFASLGSFSGAFVRVVCGCQGDHEPLGGRTILPPASAWGP